MMNEMENREMEKKKGLTLEEFKILWEERKQFNNQFGWEYNIVELRGRGNFIRADQYLSLENDTISLYYKGFRLGELKLSIIKSIL